MPDARLQRTRDAYARESDPGYQSPYIAMQSGIDDPLYARIIPHAHACPKCREAVMFLYGTDSDQRYRVVRCPKCRWSGMAPMSFHVETWAAR